MAVTSAAAWSSSCLPPSCPLPAACLLGVAGPGSGPTLHCNSCLCPPGPMPAPHPPTERLQEQGLQAPPGPRGLQAWEQISKAHALFSPPLGLRARQPHKPHKSWRWRLRGSSDAAHSQSKSYWSPPTWSQPGKRKGKRTLKCLTRPWGMRKEPSGRLALERGLLGTEETLGLFPIGLPQNWDSHLRSHHILSRSYQKKKGVLSVRGPLLPPAPFATPISGRREAQEAL